MLEHAENRVTVLSGFDADGNPVTEPLDTEAGEASGDESPRAKRRAAAARSPRRSGGSEDPGESTNDGWEDEFSARLKSSGDQGSVDDPPGLF
jgi:exodeoxyribonuclease VII small subunit